MRTCDEPFDNFSPHCHGPRRRATQVGSCDRKVLLRLHSLKLKNSTVYVGVTNDVARKRNLIQPQNVEWEELLENLLALS